MEDEKTEEELELETLEVETLLVEADVEVKVKPKVVTTPEQIESRQRAHDIKVEKFLAGGK